MVCRLIEGRYPNYNSVIPQENSFQGDNRPYLFPECLEACFRFLQSGQQSCQVAAEGERNACFRTGHRFSTSAEEKIVCSLTEPN